jgi:serine/threonine-protein kinase
MVTSALRADIRSDIYSLGVTLFELLSGRRPYHGGSLAELARQHCQDQPQDLHRLVPTLAPSVVQLVRAMMAKEPLRRPQTPLELIERLVALEIDLFDDRPEIPAESLAA